MRSLQYNTTFRMEINKFCLKTFTPERNLIGNFSLRCANVVLHVFSTKFVGRNRANDFLYVSSGYLHENINVA